MHMDNGRIPRKAYDMLYNLDARGKENWVTRVRLCLLEYGFGFVWFSQGVGNVDSFVKAFRQRLIDCSWQRWSDHIQNSHRYEFYRNFCNSPDLKPYLILDMDKHLKFITTRFRLGISELAVHHYRYRNVTENN